MTVDLNTCVPGQKCVTKDGNYFTYLNKLEDTHRYDHLLSDKHSSKETFMNDGTYDLGYPDSKYDIVCILPMESTTSDKHPSVAWWESCPWITDRKPTEEDGDRHGQVRIMIQELGAEGSTKTTCFLHWKYVNPGQVWIHCMNWQPRVLTDREQALQLLDDHQDGWRPTPEQWHIIRKGLEAS